MTSINPAANNRGAAIDTEKGAATRLGADSGSLPGAAAGDAGPARGSDAVQVSALAREAAAINSSIPREASFDANKVAALRSAISNGEYRVDTERLAEAITRLELAVG